MCGTCDSIFGTSACVGYQHVWDMRMYGTSAYMTWPELFGVELVWPMVPDVVGHHPALLQVFRRRIILKPHIVLLQFLNRAVVAIHEAHCTLDIWVQQAVGVRASMWQQHQNPYALQKLHNSRKTYPSFPIGGE
jgi:hypothetical protein